MHDINGTKLQVGDIVHIPCEVTSVSPGDEYCTLTVKHLHPIAPISETTRRDTQCLGASEVVLMSRPKPAAVDEMTVQPVGEALPLDNID